MKELFADVADGQIETYRKVRQFSFRDFSRSAQCTNGSIQAMEEWEKIISIMQRIHVDV